MSVAKVIHADAEQRVIDRLAREAGEPPYEEWNPTRAVWLEAVACGVAAERARAVELLRAEAAVEAHAPGHEAAWEALNRCANYLAGGSAALAPERTTGERPDVALDQHGNPTAISYPWEATETGERYT